MARSEKGHRATAGRLRNSERTKLSDDSGQGGLEMSDDVTIPERSLQRMDRPVRVQRRRVKGWRKPNNTVCVDRTTKWGNPFKADWPEGGKDKAWAASAFRGWYHDIEEYRAEVRLKLKGKNLACFCALNDSCHADVLLEWANDSEPNCDSTTQKS